MQPFPEQETIAKIFAANLGAESKIERLREQLAQSKQFYPEQAFHFLKTFQPDQNSKSGYRNFLDFSTQPVQIEYVQISSLKQGLVSLQQIQKFLLYFGFQATNKEVEQAYNAHTTTYQSDGLDYETFMKMVTPKLIPNLRQEMLKKKVIYEINDSQITLPQDIQRQVFELFQLEIEFFRFTEELKLKLINEFEWDPVSCFQQLDINKVGFLTYGTIEVLLKYFQKPFIPKQYLCLLSRMGKPEQEDNIAFKEFKELMTPKVPYCKINNSLNNSSNQYTSGLNSEGKKSTSPKLYTSNNKQITTKSEVTSAFNTQGKIDQQGRQFDDKPVLFMDERGRIVQKNVPKVQYYGQTQPELHEILKQNPHIVDPNNFDSNKYHIIPINQFQNHNFNLENEIEDIPKVFQQQQLETEQPQVNFTTEQMEQVQNERSRQRQLIFGQKNELTSAQSQGQQIQAVQKHPFLFDFHQKQQANSQFKSIQLQVQKPQLTRPTEVSHQVQITQPAQQEIISNPTLQEEAMNIRERISQGYSNDKHLYMKTQPENQKHSPQKIFDGIKVNAYSQLQSQIIIPNQGQPNTSPFQLH